tara:strand:- start:278 stop:484 length:207 start_codon:yes stop_codon:yes gene_type:complete
MVDQRADWTADQKVRWWADQWADEKELQRDYLWDRTSADQLADGRVHSSADLRVDLLADRWGAWMADW